MKGHNSRVQWRVNASVSGHKGTELTRKPRGVQDATGTEPLHRTRQNNLCETEVKTSHKEKPSAGLTYPHTHSLTHSLTNPPPPHHRPTGSQDNYVSDYKSSPTVSRKTRSKSRVGGRGEQSDKLLFQFVWPLICGGFEFTCWSIDKITSLAGS